MTAENLGVTLNFFIGTAAELIKLYPVINLAKERGDTVRLIASGQSRENLVMQLDDFGLPENETSWLVESHGDLGKSSSALKWFLRAWFAPMRRVRALIPDGIIIVHGDTLSTLVGAHWGKKLKLPIAHIEAGLRSASILNPFPEEINRRLVSRRATFHLAPDETAEENLRRAGVSGRVVNTYGNTLIDAVRSTNIAQKASEPFVLVNVHRFENLNSEIRWRSILNCVLKASQERKIIFVGHPQTLHKLSQDSQANELLRGARIEIRERMPFSKFIGLLKSADYLITDGGSNQEECSYLGKPCLIMREQTERREGLNTCCVLSRFDEEIIANFLKDPLAHKVEAEAQRTLPSKKILDVLSGGL